MLQSGHRLRRVMATALITVLASVVSIFVVSSPAQAQLCFSPGIRNGEGAGHMNVRTWLKTGPYSVCDNLYYVEEGTFVYFHCWWVNSYDNIWWYVRVAGTSKEGWTSASNVDLAYYDDDGNGVVEVEKCYEY